MKNVLMLSVFVITLLTSLKSAAQDDKSKRSSPPAKVSATTSAGNTITIDYSQPSLRGRKIGTELAPFGKVWRTGANEATVFEISKAAKINGKYSLPAGKYGLYSIPGEKNWTMIFNKTWNQWGTEYSEGADALRVVTVTGKGPSATEKMTFNVSKDGKVTLLWGTYIVSFTIS